MLEKWVKQKNFGSMYIGGTIANPDTPYSPNDGHIVFGDTDFNQCVPWVWVDGKWIAGAVYATGITWTALNRMGYIFGRPVRIDGVPYLCRSLKIGTYRDEPNEWDAALDATCDDNELWHWRGKYFIGQEQISENTEKKQCSIRGMIGPKDYNKWGIDSTNMYVGFRPVLEELPAEPTISDRLLGSALAVYGHGQSLGGILVDYTDYDLILMSGFDVNCPTFKSLARKCGREKIVINRAEVTYLSTTDNPQHPPVAKRKKEES